MAVCIIWVSVRGVGECQKCSCPHAPQIGETQSPIYQSSMGNSVPGGRNSILNRLLKLNHLFSFLEVLYLVFACICNEKDFKIIKFWNTFDTSVLYSIKSTRCGGMIYILPCRLFPF